MIILGHRGNKVTARVFFFGRMIIAKFFSSVLIRIQYFHNVVYMISCYWFSYEHITNTILLFNIYNLTPKWCYKNIVTVTLLFSHRYNDYRYPNLPYRLNAIKSLPFHTTYSSYVCILHHSHLFVGPEEKFDVTRPRDR